MTESEHGEAKLIKCLGSNKMFCLLCLNPFFFVLKQFSTISQI